MESGGMRCRKLFRGPRRRGRRLGGLAGEGCVGWERECGIAVGSAVLVFAFARWLAVRWRRWIRRAATLRARGEDVRWRDVVSCAGLWCRARRREVFLGDNSNWRAAIVFGDGWS